MKNGKEFAEKMFSEVENNEVQEKLYSTGNDELDELLERAFCEGYEAAQKEFSRAERKENKKSDKKMKELGIGKQDRKKILAERKAYKKNPEKFKNVEDMSSKNPETRKKANKENTKRIAKVLVPAEGAAGAAAGALIGQVHGKTGKGALIGAGLGAAYGAGVTALNHKVYKKRSEKAEETPGGLNDQSIEKDRDTSKVAKGEMSEEKYAKKYAKRRIKH
jgi:hypothetical protein